MGKNLIIKGANFSAVAIEQIIPAGVPVIYISVGGNVTITATDSIHIYYTIDGTIPNKNSNIYSGQFTIQSGTIVKAVAESEYGILSNVSTKEYNSTFETIWYTQVETMLDVTSGGSCSVQGNAAQYKGFGTLPNNSNGLLDKPINKIKSYITTNYTSYGDNHILIPNTQFGIYHTTTSDGYGSSCDLLTTFTLTQTDIENGYVECSWNTPITLTSENAEFIGIGYYETPSGETDAGTAIPAITKTYTDGYFGYPITSASELITQTNKLALINYGYEYLV